MVLKNTELLNMSATSPQSISALQSETGDIKAGSLDATELHFTSRNTLDPSDWQSLREQGHRMLDDMINHMSQLHDKPVWQPIPQAKRDLFTEPLPQGPNTLEAAHKCFMEDVLPYSIGNASPGFMGWVQGGGSPVGMLADMLASGLNANLGGRDQMPVEVERQILQWMRELFHFPDTASGLFVTGASIANMISVLVARNHTLGHSVRHEGLADNPKKLVAYTSAGAHGCITQAIDLCGIGTDYLRVIALDDHYQMNIAQLKQTIADDRAKGLTPFFIAGSAGTVDVGAIDDLEAIAEVAANENLWFHIDGAFGAMAMLSKKIAPRLIGIERANSIAFDFHKWLQVPYDAGFVIVRDGAVHHDTFASPSTYLRRETRGLAAGSPWPCDFGPDLSRGFKALKTWFTIQVYGTDKLGSIIDKTCDLAQYLKIKVEAELELEMMAPVALNVVCFRYRGKDKVTADQLNDMNADIVADLHESGLVAPSATSINGHIAIRAAMVNHRIEKRNVDILVEQVLKLGRLKRMA
jgi:aromatic-L-amino-acid decarboxylase